MQVILKENIGKLGKVGDLVAVKSGFARNFLFPQDKALRATKDNKDAFDKQRKDLEKLETERLKLAEAKAAKLKEISLEIKAKAGDEGKLFGSIGTRDLANLLNEKGVEVEKQQLRMPHGIIRELGEYEFSIHLYADIEISLKVVVIAED
jgi:large subunit ribosomal protein L9